MTKNIIHNEDCLQGLKKLPDNSVDCCVTSSPYFGLRDYNLRHTTWPEVKFYFFGTEIVIPEMSCCLGLEPSPMAYVGHMVAIFREVRRVLRKDGTLWLNLGDSYNGYPGGVTRGGKLSGKNQHARHFKETGYGLTYKDLKPKDLIGIPWMVAYALRDGGYYLRQDIIWQKPNPMPESVTDRCTKSHEYLFLLTKSRKYYFDQDAIRQPLKDQSIARLAQDIAAQEGSDRVPGKTNGKMKAVVKGHPIGGNGKYQDGSPYNKTKSGKDWSPKMAGGGSINDGRSGYFDKDGNLLVGPTANKKSVWTVTTKPFKEAHFATFPPDLIIDCIKAGSPVDGIILDPFMGSGTTAMVAAKLNRHYIGFELNPEYIRIAHQRLHKELGLFNPAT